MATTPTSNDANDVNSDTAAAPGRATPLVRTLLALVRTSLPRLRKGLIVFVTIVTVLCGQTTIVYGLGNGAGRQLSKASASVGNSGKPNHADPTSGAASIRHAPPPSKLPSSTPLTARPPMSHGFRASMQPGHLVLDPANPSKFVGSDGRLEVDLPAGAISGADVASAGGTIALQITQIAQPGGSTAGGSGLVSFGTYSIEVVDAAGKRLTHGLRKAATLKFHYGSQERIFDLDHAFVVFNGSHPVGLSAVGPYSVQQVTHDQQNQVLVAQLPADTSLGSATPSAPSTVAPSAASTPTKTTGASGVTGSPSQPLAYAVSPSATQQTPMTSFTWATWAPVAKFGSPDPFNVDLNAGSVTDGIKIDVPPGPAQAMPDLTLAYNSAAVSEQHNPQGAAGWVGEGWNLSLGEITWAEHNVTANCLSTCGSTWENSWYLSDPFGTSTELLPQDNAVSTYYDDTHNFYCAMGNSSSDTCPLRFYTARETHAKVYAYVGPNKLGAAPLNPPCFRVYLTNGVMEEFGCTADSLQYFPIQANSMPGQANKDLYYTAAWKLDLITNPQGAQVHITYQSDTETAPDGLSYPRDTVPSTIEWDSPDCVSATQACSSSTWHPHYRVQGTVQSKAG